MPKFIKVLQDIANWAVVAGRSEASVAASYSLRRTASIKRYTCIGLFVLSFLSFGIWPKQHLTEALANSYNTSIYDLKYLKGIKTLAVDFINTSDYMLMHDYLSSPLAKPGANVGETLVDALKEVFVDEARVTPDLYQFITSKGDIDNANSIIVHFSLAAQAENFNGEKLRIASLSVRYFYTGKDNVQIEMKMPQASYPFIVPASHEQFLKRIREGAIYLTFYLPKYYACANESEDRTHKCLSLEDYAPWLNRK